MTAATLRLPLDSLDSIERSRETVEGVWRGLLVMNFLGVIGLPCLAVVLWAINPARFAEMTVGRSFFSSLQFMFLLSLIVTGLSILLARSAERMHRATLLVATLAFLTYLAFSLVQGIGFLIKGLLEFAGKPDIEAVVIVNFTLGMCFFVAMLLMLVPLVRITVAAYRTPSAQLLAPTSASLKTSRAMRMGLAGGHARPEMRLFGWPAHIPSIGPRRTTAFLLFMLASLLYGLGFFLGLNHLTGMMGASEDFLLQARRGTVTAAPFPANVMYAVLPLNIAISVAIVVAMSYLSRLIERRAQTLVRYSMTEALASDTRPPVVFLRAFGDDQVKLTRSNSSGFARFMDIGAGVKRLDHIVLQEGFAHGPVVALGRPGDPFPPYGAARGYFQDADWRDAVAKLCRETSAIVFCIDDTDGVWWEFDHILATREFEKTLFLIHPDHAAAAANSRLLDRLLERSRTADSSAIRDLFARCRALSDSAPVVGFYLLPDGRGFIGSSTRFHHRQYKIMIRSFLRSLGR